jgi:hypothetical protein
MTAAEVRRAMWLTPLAMGTLAVGWAARVAAAAIDEEVPVWLAGLLIVVSTAWSVALVISALRRYRSRLWELSDPITGSLSIGEPPTPLRLSTHLWLIGSPVLVAVTIGLVVVLPGAGNTCVTKGIATAVAREGICKRDANLFGGGVTYNVVDAGHVLHMPGYDAQLLATTTRTGPVNNAAENPTLYPNGLGMLVCLKVAITNRGATALTYDAGGADVDLVLQGRSSGSAYDFPDVPNVVTEPSPSVAAMPPIQPGHTAVGWVAFVAPLWVLDTLNARATDLDFLLPANGDAGPSAAAYIGQIRLWKAANTAGARALTNHPQS